MRKCNEVSATCAWSVVSGSRPASTIALGIPAAISFANVGPDRNVARAALITRGLAEITRIGVAMGAQPATFAGLSGMGDLVLTCSGDASRNRRVGLALGAGKAMPDILAEMNQVAEGVKTAKVAKQLAEKLGVAAPITDAMYAIMHAGVPVREAIYALMARPIRSERD